MPYGLKWEYEGMIIVQATSSMLLTWVCYYGCCECLMVWSENMKAWLLFRILAVCCQTEFVIMVVEYDDKRIQGLSLHSVSRGLV